MSIESGLKWIKNAGFTVGGPMDFHTMRTLAGSGNSRPSSTTGGQSATAAKPPVQTPAPEPEQPVQPPAPEPEQPVQPPAPEPEQPVQSPGSNWLGFMKQIAQTPAPAPEQPAAPVEQPAPAPEQPVQAPDTDYTKIFGKSFNPGASKADAWLKEQADKLIGQGYDPKQVSVMLGPDAWRRYGRKNQDYVVSGRFKPWNKQAAASPAVQALFDRFTGASEELDKSASAQASALAALWNDHNR